MSAKQRKKPKVASNATPPLGDAASPASGPRPSTARPTPASRQRPSEPAPKRFVSELYAPDPPTPRPPRTKWLALAAILVACCFGTAVRAVWLAADADDRDSHFEGERLLTTADGYFYASGVQHAVEDTLANNPRVPHADDNVLVALGAAVVSLTGLPVERVCLWLPAFVAPLIAVPLVLLGLLFGRLAWGFLASLVTVLGFSYWNRTVPGYFDTDMVSIPYVTGVALLLVAAFWRRRPQLGAIAALLTTIAPYMHPGSERVIAALTLGVLGYAVVFTRREPYAYRIALAMFVALLPIPWWLRMPLIIALELAQLRLRPPLWTLVAATGAAFVLVTWLNPAMDLVLGIIGIKPTGGGALIEGVRFPGIGDTVAELANPSLAKLSERVAGHTALLVTGALGYLAACWRYRPLLLLAPLFALGTVLAAQGQRYTIFAVPVAALGTMWLAVEIARLASSRIPRARRLVELAIAGALAVPAVVPAVAHALAYPHRTAVNNDEATLLTKLAPRVAAGDFLITWWDYAYGAWFHSGVNTVIDGSKQNEDLWIVAELLFTPSQREAAALARLAAEYQPHHGPMEAVIDDIIADWQRQGGGAPSDFVPALREGRVPLPAPTRQTFLYLPWRILMIAPNIATIRPAKGLVPDRELTGNAFLVANPLGAGAGRRSPWQYDAASQSLVSQSGQRVPVHKVVTVKGGTRGRLEVDEQVVGADGAACVVNLTHSRTQLLMGRPVYESVLTQLLILGRYDTNLFEQVAYTRGGVLYRVK